MAEILGIAGLIVGVISVVLAIRERFIREQLELTLTRVEAEKIREIWTKIGIDATVFDSLDDARSILRQRHVVDHEVLGKVESARRGTIDLYRLILKEAAAAEADFTMDTISKWRKAGKLENEWRVRAAMRLLPTNKIPDCSQPSPDLDAKLAMEQRVPKDDSK
ncbi:MAG: hypothetical protein NTZ04_01660 [Chloroflexi bacterium]|nr:hypothetical protein [Chloroflexota bacterium]